MSDTNIAIAYKHGEGTLLIQQEKRTNKIKTVLKTLKDGESATHDLLVMSEISDVAVVMNLLQDYCEEYKKKHPDTVIPDIRRISFNL